MDTAAQLGQLIGSSGISLEDQVLFLKVISRLTERDARLLLQSADTIPNWASVFLESLKRKAVAFRDQNREALAKILEEEEAAVRAARR